MTDQQITIGVSIPTKNRRNLLRVSLKSVLAQKRPADEIFISDNSDEPDEGILEEFPGAPIRYHWHSEPLSAEDHCHWCVKQLKSDYISYMQDDDCLMEDHLELMETTILKFPSATVFGSIAHCFTERVGAAQLPMFASIWQFDLITREPVLIPQDCAIATFLFGTPFSAPTVVVRRDFIDQSGAFVASGARMSFDRWIFVQAAALGDTVYLPRHTVMYRIHPNNITHRASRRTSIENGNKVTGLILEKLHSLGIDPVSAIEHLHQYSTPSSTMDNGLSILRTRNREWIKTYLPTVLAKPNLTACLPAVVAILARQLIRKFILRRFRFFFS